MRLAAVLALLAAARASAVSDPLAEARAAFAAKDYARAERLALSVRPPKKPSQAALYLAGLARFRAGRPAEALAALDLAPHGGDSVAAWHYNRAACLQELGRLGEAEREYLAAAGDATLAPLALVGAGWAALDAGGTERVPALVARARAVARGNAVGLVEDLEAELATALGPPAAPARPPAAAPDPAPAPPPAPPRLEVREVALRLSAGWDSDALLSGFDTTERPTAPGVAVGSAFADVGAGASARLRGSDDVAGELAYTFTQLAFRAPVAQDRSVQQHGMTAALLLRPGAPLRLDVKAEGQLAFAGLADFRPLLASGGLRLTAAADHGARLTSRLEVAAATLSGRSAEFIALGGHRVQAAAAEELRLPRLTVRAGYRLQLERIGWVFSAAPPLPPQSPQCPYPTACAVTLSDPLAYTSHTGWLDAAWRPLRWLELRLEGGLEWRGHVSDQEALVTAPDGTTLRRTDLGGRVDLRAFTGESATVHLSEHLSLFVAHALLANRPSTVVSGRTGMMMGAPDFHTDAAAAAADAARWTKHVFSAGTELVW